MLEGREFEIRLDPAEEIQMKKMRESLQLVKSALADLLVAESHLMNAAGKIFGTPDDDRLTSLSMSVEDLECDVRKQIRRMERMV